MRITPAGGTIVVRWSAREDMPVSGSMKAAWLKDPDGNVQALVSR
jgi:hypothetical protein